MNNDIQPKNLETSYFKDILKNCRVSVICAGKGSGKSHLFLSIFNLFYNYKLYDLYILLIPELYTEVDGKYDYLLKLNKVVIYTEYDDEILDYVKNMSKTHKIFCCFDDSTNYMFKNKYSEELTKLCSTTRHGKGVQFYLITHALSNILLPHVRALIDNFFIGVFSNNKLIKTLFEENFSLVMEYDEFKNMYVNTIMKQEDSHPFLYFNRKREYDNKVNEWDVLEYYEQKPKSNGKAKIVDIDHDKELIEKIKNKKHYNELKKKYDPKPETRRNGILFSKIRRR